MSHATSSQTQALILVQKIPVPDFKKEKKSHYFSHETKEIRHSQFAQEILRSKMHTKYAQKMSEITTSKEIRTRFGTRDPP
jgi:hypothetical protein